MTGLIFHLAEPGDWARSTDTYSAPSVEEQGFVHCSGADQLAAVARNLYRRHNALVLLTIDPKRLDDGTLVYEDLDDLGEDYPHIYGPIPTSAVLTTGPYLAHLEEGLWLETRFDQEWMDRILHPDFTEVGMSGRTLTRAETIDTPPTELPVLLPHEEYRTDVIDEDVVLAHYISHDSHDGVDRHAHRTSVWVNTNQGWRLRFHQGTPVASGISSRP